jgi:predicted TIM-barrel fold metal-dependent hydrolase
MLILDTHAHIYAPDEKRYPPIDKPMRPPGGKGSLEDLRRESSENGVSGVCIIQTSSFYRFDNRYILDSAKAAPGWTAGVCTLDPDDPHSPGLLQQYKRDYGIRGMRSIAAGNGRFDHPGVRALWKTALDEGIVINALSPLATADQVDQLVGEFPALPVVLDHCLNPEIGPNLEKTVQQVVAMARRPNLHAKLSFIPTGSKTGYPCANMHEPCRRIIEAFTPRRCIWGSDFPCELWMPRVTYAEHLNIFRQALQLNEQTLTHILGDTAKRLWFANRP